MKLQGIRLATALVLAPLLLATGAALAQADDSRYGPAPYGDYSHRGAVDDRAGPWRGSDPQPAYDWARVLRVDPVFDDRGQPVHDRRDCRVRRDGYVTQDPYGDRYGDPYGGDPYARGGDYRGGPDGYGQPRRDGNGRLVASVLGGIAGAVLGSRIGDGSGQVIGTAVGTVVGSAAGGGIYDQRRAREATVTVCDPEPQRGGYGGYASRGSDRDGRAVVAYDVTYEYAGREYVTRTDHHPGDRIRVRVDVRAE